MNNGVNPKHAAFQEFIAPKSGMINPLEAFEAGWDAAMDCCMQPIETMKKAPGEGATSDQRTEQNPTTSIPPETKPVNG